MAISFNETPTNLRVPFFAVEFDSSRAQQGPALLPYRVLLLGQRLPTGAQPANKIMRVTNADEVATAAGRGSMLHRMALKYFANNRMTETWIGLVADPSGSPAAYIEVTFGGEATEAGVIALYLGGERVSIPVAVGDTPDIIVANAIAAVNANPNLPVFAQLHPDISLPYTMLVFYRHAGNVGNWYDVRFNYQDGDAFPAGVQVSPLPGSAPGRLRAYLHGGFLIDPDLGPILAALGDSWFQIIAHPWASASNATALTALETELASRFGPMRMIDGLAITSAAGSLMSVTTVSEARNSPHSCIVASPGDFGPTQGPEVAAAVAGVLAKYGNIDPARPFQTLRVDGVLAPEEMDLFTLAERNLALYDGIATTRLAAGGVVQIDRMITTYKRNAGGADDTAYLDVTTMLTLMYFRYTFRNRMTTRYPRHKLADDGVRFGAGQAVITPKIGRAEAIAWFREMEELGLIEGFDQFKAELVVERNASDPNRLDFLLPADLINQLVVGAASIQFRL